MRKNTIKAEALAQAQVILAQRISSVVKSELELKLSNKDNNSTSESKLSSIANSEIYANKTFIEDSKSFIKKDNKYEYWAVFSIKIKDLVKVVNSIANLNLDKDFYKAGIENNFFLESKKSEDSLVIVKTDFPNSVIEESKKYIGVPYVWGGDDPLTGFDCSGYVQWVINEAIDLFTPRTSIEQYNYFKKTSKGNVNDILPGDILFFKTSKSEVSHVGIAIEKNTFIHAPNSKSKIRIDNLQGYWLNNFVAGYQINK